MLRTLCIWWTTQSDTEKIGEDGFDDRTDVPEYLKTEFNSRYGRNGRGRLWISPTLEGAPSEIPWDETKTACRMITKGSMGGIMMNRADIALLPQGIGFITDLNCDLLMP
ncbi:hypothetical protein EBT25_06745 [bacterium]|nr:hypothetical protein [bacterium]